MKMYNVLKRTDGRFSVQNIALHEQSDYAILSGKLVPSSTLPDTEINAPDVSLRAMLECKMKRGR